jgi:hypothetical protein
MPGVLQRDQREARQSLKARERRRASWGVRRRLKKAKKARSAPLARRLLRDGAALSEEKRGRICAPFVAATLEKEHHMVDMAELQRRKQPLNLAIVYVDPDAFLEHFLGWLEITSFVSALRAGDAQPPADGLTPALTPQQLKSGVVANVAHDAIFAFCMTAALKGENSAVDKIEAGLVETFGAEFPGKPAMWSFRSAIDAPTTLDDHVGKAAQKMLAGDLPPPPLRARENWGAGLRFLEKARKSNFVHEIVYPLAVWHRERWTETAEKGVAFLHHIEDNLPILQDALKEARNDEPFVADLLLKMAPDVRGFLRSLSRRL